MDINALNETLKTNTDATIEQNPIIWGPHTWATIHSFALRADSINDATDFKDFLKTMETLLPCSTCRNDFKQYIAYSKPTAGTAFEWSVDFHNYVNKKTNKPTIDITQARSIWLSEACSYTCTKGLNTGLNKKASKKSGIFSYIILVCLIAAIVFFLVQWKKLKS